MNRMRMFQINDQECIVFILHEVNTDGNKVIAMRHNIFTGNSIPVKFKELKLIYNNLKDKNTKLKYWALMNEINQKPIPSEI